MQLLLCLSHHVIFSFDEAFFHLSHLTMATFDSVLEALNLLLNLLSEVRVLDLLEG